MTTKITIWGAERTDVIVDFTAFAGRTIVLKNTAKAPFPNGTGMGLRQLIGLWFDDPIEDFPQKGSTEIWYYVDLTTYTHPMHPHLVNSQVYGRVPFNALAYETAWLAWIAAGRDPATRPSALAFATGPRQAPGPDEIGWKDTVRADVGMITQIVAKFDIPPGSTPTGPNGGHEYVHHCHILEHEENEMMRPFEVIP